MDVLLTLGVSALCLLVAGLWPVCLGQTRYQNVALNKQCTMNSTWSGPPNNIQSARNVQLAVNGNTNGGRDANLLPDNCVHSGYEDRSTYWEVNLGRFYPLHRMISYGRHSFAGRMSSITVTVNDVACYTYPSNVNEQKTEFNCSSVLHGDKVRLTKVTPSGNDYAINLCEFEVYSCKDPFWGDQCQHDCGQCRGQEVCNKVTGVCTSCKPGWKETQAKYCIQECDPGTYGDGCRSTCSSNCNPSNMCHHVDGHCPCSPGWKPGTCHTACDDGHYGQNCTGLCGQGCSPSPCNKTDGRCSCSPGWVPPLCQQDCPDHTFGQDCGSNCSAHCVDVCDKRDGSCSCDLGHKPPDCEQPCPDGRYGQDCVKDCSDNCQHTCNKQTGHCTCKPGWRGDLCDQECQSGRYGLNCSEQCGRCEDANTTCNHVDGACQSCLNHFAIPLCKECQDYYHGDDCSLSCSENCQSGTPCNKSNGHCQCIDGWEGLHCTQACSPGRYGEGCQFPCGNCSTDEPVCHHINGTCLEGCQPGFKSALCNIPMVEKQSGAGGDVNTGVIAGAVVGGLVIAAIAGVVIVIWRRRKSPKGTESILSDNNASSNSSNRTGDHVYQNVALDISPHNMAMTHQAETTKPVAAVKPETKKKRDKSLYTNVPDGATPSTSSPPSTSAAEADAAEPIGLDDVMVPPDAYYNDDTYMTSEAAGLGLDGVQQSLLNKLRGKAFVGEFQKLEAGFTRDHEVGSAEENYYRNRFTSIVPYDDNRIVLHSVPHEGGANDYINASYIRSWNSDKAYIAAQGPRENTVSDMWWMVWQLNLSHIVMLTSCVEREKRKCEEYWPAQGKQRKYGVIYVANVNTQVRADYVIRTFTVRMGGGTGSREVTQYHFVTWQDHDVPTVTSLVDFWRSVSRSHRKQQPKAPLLVHCSAGVGRTGAFIAIDSLMQQAQHSTKLDVQQTAARLRHDRTTMIQTKVESCTVLFNINVQSQYRLVYEAVLEAYTSRDCRTDVTSLGKVLTSEVDPSKPNQYIDTQFKKLQQAKVLATKPDYTTAESEENINKNRDISVLPDENHMVYLTYYVRGRNQYINAVFTTTFFRRRGCILTQLPFQQTAVDFWRLVAGNDVKTVVSLGSESDPDQYWPQLGESMTYGPFTVTLTSQTSLGRHLTSCFLSLAPQDREQSHVRLLHYSAWGGELPDDLTDLLQLLHVLTDEDARDTGPAPFVLQCRDGARRCGMLRAICDVINRMTSDGEVDVFAAVKHVQNSRPQSIMSETQYRYVFHVLQRYMDINIIYQNT